MWKLDRTQLGKRFFVLFLAMALSLALIIGCNGGGGGGDDDDDDDGGGSSITFKVNEADWRRVLTRYDLNNNGTIDHKVTRTYDGNDNLKRENVDLGNDDIIDEYEEYDYDVNNFLEEIEVDSDNDGTYEIHELETYANGLPRLDTVYHDSDSNPDYQIEYTYDANGYPESLTFTNLTGSHKIKYWIWDEAVGSMENRSSRTMSSGGAIADFDYTWTYNSSGDMTYEIYDLNSDDVNESITSWTYTTVGNRLIVREDQGDNGSVDSVIYTTYDTDGNETVEEIDSDNNLVMDEAEYYEYDSYGNRIEERDDEDMDGNIDDADYWDYEILGNGNLQVTEESDDDGDGNIDNVIIMTYERRP